jgi:hypothetical protein
MRLRCLVVAGGLSVLLVLFLVHQQAPPACRTHELPGRFHTVQSWPPPQPVRVEWKFPKPGSCDVTQLFETYPITAGMLQRARVPGVAWEGWLRRWHNPARRLLVVRALCAVAESCLSRNLNRV